MKMNKKTISPYNIALIILALCLCLVLSFAILTPSLQVYADYNELPENTIVNFNQYIQNDKINGTYNAGQYYSNVLPVGKYYINIESSDTADILLVYSGGGYYRLQVRNGSYSNIFTINNQISAIQFDNNITYTNFNAINLTQMFGSDNDNLTLEQCKELFSADYYNYTTGTQMPLSKSYLQGYQEGANDVWESLTTTYNNDILGTITTPSTINGFESNVAYDSQYSRYLVEGLAQLDFGATITSQVNYKGTYWLSNYSGGIYIVFFKYEGSVLTPLIISEITQAPSNVQNATPYCDITFNINNVQQIYFGFFTSTNTFNNDTSTTMYCWTSELELNTIDVALLIQSSYTRGVIETTKEYSEGGSKYDTIYNLGKAEGIAESNGYATGLDVIATTFTQVFSIFNIEILPGIPLTIFILLPLLVGLIFFIVKMTKGD